LPAFLRSERGAGVLSGERPVLSSRRVPGPAATRETAGTEPGRYKGRAFGPRNGRSRARPLQVERGNKKRDLCATALEPCRDDSDVPHRSSAVGHIAGGEPPGGSRDRARSYKMWDGSEQHRYLAGRPCPRPSATRPAPAGRNPRGAVIPAREGCQTTGRKPSYVPGRPDLARGTAGPGGRKPYRGRK
jgi:hypothetical protein